MDRPVKAYRVLGTSDEMTTCDLCGREGLRSTVALQPLDPDGGDLGDPVYFGCDCAARAMGWTQKDVRRDANAADRAKEVAAQKRRQAIDFAIVSDPAVRAAEAAYAIVHTFAVPFAVRRTWPEYIARTEAERTARARAEASL